MYINTKTEDSDKYLKIVH